MRNHFRTVAVILLVAFAFSPRPALAISPPQPLKELLQLYRDLGLPLPPKTAKLQVFTESFHILPRGGVAAFLRGGFGGGGGGGFGGGGFGGIGFGFAGNAPGVSVAFVTKEADDLTNIEFFARFRNQHSVYVTEKGRLLDITKPLAVKLKTLDDELIVGIQCEALGYPVIARSLLARCPELSNRVKARTALRAQAWKYWHDQIYLAPTERRAIAKRLRALLDSDPDLDDGARTAFIKLLELSLKPSTASSGSVEFLIDSLVDFKLSDMIDEQSPFRRLVFRGFEAVPDLFAHLNDDRMTCVLEPDANQRLGRQFNVYRVRDVVAQILGRLAAFSVPDLESSAVPQVVLDKPKTIAWWLTVRNRGEECYLASAVLRDNQFSFTGRTHLTQILLEKYPSHLMAVYDAYKLGNIQMDEQAWNQWWRSLANLARIDPQTFNVFLVERLHAIPRYISGSYRNCFEARLAKLALKSTDQQVWQTLARAAQQTELGLRLEILDCLSDPDETSVLPDRIRFLLKFLDDDQIRDRTSSFQYEKACAASEYKKISVRDFAALQICKLAKQDVPVDPKRTADEWTKIRARARQLVDQKLKETK